MRHTYITKIELKNIRCFKDLSVTLEDESNTMLWTMIIGNNSAGKTTLLRSIALGLCHEGDATYLMKEIPGSFIRRREKEGQIRVTLREEDTDNVYTITTKITKRSEGSPEIVRQLTEPEEQFPWENIFVCGYGAQRIVLPGTSYDKYIPKNAVLPLFDYEMSLQNPELILLRQDHRLKEKVENKLLEILTLDASEHKIIYSKKGLRVQGPRGILPFEVLGDGYASTMHWVLDFIGWLIYAKYFDSEDIGGILLIDELEQHLHPKWQRHIVQRIRKQFPKTQIITTTHTPLTASGIADIENAMLLKLNEGADNSVAAQIIRKEMLEGKRADQILSSEAFDLVTTRSPGSEDDLSKYAELSGKTRRTHDEDDELRQLSARLKETLIFGENDFEQLVEKAVSEVLDRLLEKPSSELLDLETKRQLRELFRTGEQNDQNYV